MNRLSEQERERFDQLLEVVLSRLPPHILSILDEVPLIVLDRPTPELLRGMELQPGEILDPDLICGLHSGIPNTDQSVQHSGELPSQIHLFRSGIIASAGGWYPEEPDEEDDAAVLEEIRITLLHEIGHQFGLDEDDLADLGYD